MPGHPCFDESAHDRVGRVHLPVAPACNIQCIFCTRRVCANLTMQHPGWARRLLTPEEALGLVRGLVRNRPGERFVVGVAGPGEPLANQGTFTALEAVHREFPQLTSCVSTNGLLLEERLPELLAVGISALTVTMNALEPRVGQRIYTWVRHEGRTYWGEEGAGLLIERQLSGVEAALAAGLGVKVNTVLIPGANDGDLPRLARAVADRGVRLMNIMPLIPPDDMPGLRAPTCEEIQRARDDCETWLPQFRRCEQCSADVMAFPPVGAGCGTAISRPTG